MFVMFTSIGHAESKGTLTVAGKPVALNNVYAYLVKGFFDPKKDDTVVVMADAPMTDAVARDSFARNALVAQGKLHYVEVTIDQKGQIVNFKVGHNAFQYAPGGGSTEHQFAPKVRDGKTISGTVFTVGPQKGPLDGPAYDYKIEFSTPLQPKK